MENLRLKYEGDLSVAIPLYKTVNRRQKKLLEKERILIEDNFLEFDLHFQKIIFTDGGLSYSDLFEHHAKEFVKLCNVFTKRFNLKYHKIDKGYFIKTYGS